MPGSGHHQSSPSGNFYTSGPADDPRAQGGHFVSTGNRDGHTTFVYDSNGQSVDVKSSGDGGPAANVNSDSKK